MEIKSEKKRKKRKKPRVDALHSNSDSAEQRSDNGAAIAPEKLVGKKTRKRREKKDAKTAPGVEKDVSDTSTKPLTNWDRLKGTLKSKRKKAATTEDGMVINITMDTCNSVDVRGHLTKVLALDCEMVGGGVGGQLSLLARVSIVNASGDVVYDTFVTPTERITDYRTQWSGIRPKDLIGAPTKQSVVEKVRSILAGRILVGHALQNDLEALNISHPESHVRDSSRYPQFMRKLICGKLKPKALRHIVAEELDMTIQTGEHDSIQDARAVLGLYQKHKSSWEMWHSKEMKRLKKQRKKNST